MWWWCHLSVWQCMQRCVLLPMLIFDGGAEYYHKCTWWQQTWTGQKHSQIRRFPKDKENTAGAWAPWKTQYSCISQGTTLPLGQGLPPRSCHGSHGFVCLLHGMGYVSGKKRENGKINHTIQCNAIQYNTISWNQMKAQKIKASKLASISPLIPD